MLISASKCSKTSSYWHQLAQEIMLLSVSKLHEKRITESQEGRNFGGTRGLIESFIRLQLYNRVTWKMHSFSAKQARVIFSPISLFWNHGSQPLAKSIFYSSLLYSVDDDKSPPFPPKILRSAPPPTLHFKFQRFHEKANFYATKLF